MYFRALGFDRLWFVSGIEGNWGLCDTLTLAETHFPQAPLFYPVLRDFIVIRFFGEFQTIVLLECHICAPGPKNPCEAGPKGRGSTWVLGDYHWVPWSPLDLERILSVFWTQLPTTIGCLAFNEHSH